MTNRFFSWGRIHLLGWPRSEFGTRIWLLYGRGGVMTGELAHGYTLEYLYGLL